MKHLIICREFPPAPSGGIGTYVVNVSRLLAESGETVHVIGQTWKGAEKEIDEQCNGRLIVHRVPLEDWRSILRRRPHKAIKSAKTKALFESSFYPQCFSWQATMLAEKIIEQEGIDLVEAQEYEAPLYYLQLRRALGFGPRRRPPCVVHLHSPTEFIVKHNGRDIGHPYFLTAKRLEDYSIAAADALLCPSSYLARQARAHYGLAEAAIEVIPYPIDNCPRLERDSNTWQEGGICYVGRLEARKGLIEWTEAAVAVGRQYRSARFEFAGTNILDSNWLTGEEVLDRRIPTEMKSRFRFHGHRERTALPKFLSSCRIAVVPSRWDNFPNTCMEAMGSGLPVIATGEGGMAEMIEDGRTGWLAKKSGSFGLREALQRALETPPPRLAEMGQQASAAIHEMCDSHRIVDRHLTFRAKVARQGASRSFHLPANLPSARRSVGEARKRPAAQNTAAEGLAIVVSNVGGDSIEECLRSVAGQTQKAAALVIVHTQFFGEQIPKIAADVGCRNWQTTQIHDENLTSARNAGIEVIRSSDTNPLGVVFLDSHDRLAPEFVAVCQSVLRHSPGVAIVSPWLQDFDTFAQIAIKVCPSFPYQWLSNDVASCSAVRAEALYQVGSFRSLAASEYEYWDLVNAIMAAGWTAVTVPEVLSYRRLGNAFDAHVDNIGMLNAIYKRFPDLIARDAVDIALLSRSGMSAFSREDYTPWEQIEIARMLFRQSGKAGLWGLRTMRKRLRRRVRLKR